MVVELSGTCSHILLPHYHVPISRYDFQEGTLVLGSEEEGLEILFGFLFEIPLSASQPMSVSLTCHGPLYCLCILGLSSY